MKSFGSFVRTLALCSLSFSSAASAGYCKHSRTTLRCVEYIDNYDGDTLKVNIHDTHPIMGEGMNIRVAGIDTPEIKGKTACEKQLAVKARNEVRRILINANTIHLANIERGKYFRIAADVLADGVDVAEYLIRRKLAYRYDGGTKPDVDWCAVLLMYH